MTRGGVQAGTAEGLSVPGAEAATCWGDKGLGAGRRGGGSVCAPGQQAGESVQGSMGSWGSIGQERSPSP